MQSKVVNSFTLAFTQTHAHLHTYTTIVPEPSALAMHVNRIANCLYNDDHTNQMKILFAEYLMTGSPRTAGYPARSPLSNDAPNQHRYAFQHCSCNCCRSFGIILKLLGVVSNCYDSKDLD